MPERLWVLNHLHSFYSKNPDVYLKRLLVSEVPIPTGRSRRTWPPDIIASQVDVALPER